MLTTRKFGDDEASYSGSSGGSRISPAKGWTPPPQDAAQRLRDDASTAAAVATVRPGDPGSAPAEAQPLRDIAALHILIGDDDDSLRRACCEIARGMGFTVHGADSVPAAREVLKHQPVDLLLLDMKLPGGGGLVLLEEIKALHPETAVVVMTAYATVSSAVEAMRIGAADYLTKPFAV